MSDVQEKIVEWAGKCTHLLYGFYTLCQKTVSEPVSDRPSAFAWFVNQLAVSCHLTSESTIILIANARLWDAEILLRSVTEGSLKIAFLCMGDETERAMKAEEYGKKLPDIATLRRHQRLSAFFEAVDDSNSPDWLPLRKILISGEELGELQKSYPRKVRQHLEERWSFFKIVEALSKPDTGLPGLAPVRVLLYPYLMASHQAHQDADALNLIWDRVHRSDERRIPLERAHAARELSDLTTMAIVRTYATLMAHHCDREPLKALLTPYEDLMAELHEAGQSWWEIESNYSS